MRGLRSFSIVVAVSAAPIFLSACEFDDDDDDKKPPMLASPAALMNGVVGNALAPVTFSATGSRTIAYSVSSGSLPPGTSLNPATGEYSGTPTTAGSYSFTISATNSAGTDSEMLSQMILQLPTILNNTAAPPAGINTDGPINGLLVGATGVSGAAYTNSFGQPLTGGVTTQYVLDGESNQLMIQNPPNAGAVVNGRQLSVGDDPLEFTWVSGFDIPSDVRVMASNSPASGLGYAALM
jgi:hypothetical protein